MSITNWVEDGFKRHNVTLNGHAGATQVLREEAFKIFSEKGFPSSALEDWKYTNFSKLLKGSFKSPTAEKLGSSDFQNFVVDGLSNLRFVFINGCFAADLSAKTLPAGVQVTPLKDALVGTAAKDVDAILKSDDTFRDQSMVALNVAFLEQGLLIKIAKDAVLNEPLEIVYLASAGMNSAAQHLRNIVIADVGAQALVVERFETSTADEYFTNIVTNVSVAANARLTHVKVQNESLAASHYSKLKVRQERDSFFSSSVFHFGSRLTRNEIDPTLDGENIDSQMRGLTVLDGEQHVDNTTVLDHAKPHCQSTEHFKGIYADRSKGVFSGTIIVRPDAQKTNAFQANDAVLLSATAGIESRPQLKIWADDVRCTHGATMGQLDDDALFYIRSRGVDLKTSRKILVQAFAGEITQTVENVVLREHIQQLLEQKLEKIC